MADYLIAAGAIFAVNLMPAFGHADLVGSRLLSAHVRARTADPRPGAVAAAASGRFTLALAAQRRGRLRPKSLANLATASTHNRRRAWSR